MDYSLTESAKSGGGEFTHPSDEELEMYGRYRLTPHQASEVHSHVFACEVCRNKVDRLDPPAGNEQGKMKPDRRKDVRAELDAPIWLRVMDASAPLMEGRIVNVSKKGFKLKLPSALQPGMSVQTRIGGRIVMAAVRYCVPHGHEFYVGVEIEDVFPIPGKTSEE
jgi:hypothetical protein